MVRRKGHKKNQVMAGSKSVSFPSHAETTKEKDELKKEAVAGKDRM